MSNNDTARDTERIDTRPTWAEKHAALMARVEANVVDKPRPAERTLAGAAGLLRSRANLRKAR